MRAFEPEPLATTIRGFGLDFYYHRVKLGQDLEIYFRNIFLFMFQVKKTG